MKRRRSLNVISGPLLFAAVFAILDIFIPAKQAAAIASIFWMGLWWVLRPVNIAVTALLPIPLNAFFGMVPMDGIISKYFSEIVVLLVGSDLISLVWEKTKLDKRLAIKSLCGIGTSVREQIAVWLVASTLLSIFLPNVVVVMILLPVAVSMLKFLGQEQIMHNPVATPILLAIVWGAGFGGFGSPLGSSSNLVAISYLEKLTGREFMYVDWVMRFLPLLFIIMFFILAFLLRLPVPVARLEGGKEYFRSVYAGLGPMKRGEKLGLWLFVLAMALAFVRPLYVQYLPLMKPAYVFFSFGMLTFVLRNETGQLLLSWKEAEKGVMWGMIFLFSGGLALGKLITDTGAAAQIAKVITLLPLSGGWETMFSLTLFATFLTEISSNTAAASISIPVVQSITQQLGLNPIPYILTSIVAVNCAFILPVSTRAVGVTYGLSPDDLMRQGVRLSVMCMLLVSLLGYVCMKFWPLFLHL
ncbi:MAG: SLC13 family permease [Phascolarctobacterium sp.]|uniref:SLC13 family permease n=1 Tax=Phascolarctobacterium sp. TaxID=2049039 RepID=UPI0026DC70B9|nr:SLC13 family permease [Phascolarctobacterium sp.]MDO4922374.1 SLC13 family permease [Phascolarctobacterium sp.]